MRRLALLVLLATSAAAQPVTFNAFVSARGVNATGPASWLEGGFGRLGAGGDRDELLLSAQAGVTWTPVKWLELHASGVARREPEEFGGERGGLVEAYAAVRHEWTNDEVQVRAGQFFLPTSRENKGPLWTSPYSITFSAVNSWIGEEVRPMGVDLQWRHQTGRGQFFTFGGTAFRGNDSMGTLLGWRGWALHNRLTVYNEVLPLPPIASLQTFFVNQRDDGTKPFGSDLDGNTGYSARVRWSLPERATVQLTHVDNNGDRLLYRGEYAWDTAFDVLGVEIGNPENLIVAAEYMTGRTGMGLTTKPARVDADFSAGYVLLSEKRGRNRFTARIDRFQTDEQDFTPAESNDESGRSWMFAWLFDVTKSIRAGAEFLQVTGDRPAAQQSGFDPGTNGRTVTLELRYAF
jgi:hypothetical protein